MRVKYKTIINNIVCHDYSIIIILCVRVRVCLLIVRGINACVCVCGVYASPFSISTSRFSIAAVVNIDSRCGLRIEVHHTSEGSHEIIL